METKTKGWLIFVGSFFVGLSIVILLAISPFKIVNGLGMIIGLLTLPFMMAGYRMTETKPLGG